jgi:hypothetical protein
MQDGRPAAVSNIQLDEKTFGHRMDVLRALGSGNDLPMAAAMNTLVFLIASTTNWSTPIRQIALPEGISITLSCIEK